jgi:thymidylate synthase (FAD)
MTPYSIKEESRDSLELVSSDPRLYLLSRPLLDLQEFSKFLEDEATDWKRTSGATDAENITELAGRICYMSFGRMQSPKSNLNILRILFPRNTKASLNMWRGHSC